MQEKEQLQKELTRVAGDLVQKAVELSEIKQAFAISKEEYESVCNHRSRILLFVLLIYILYDRDF
jgi:hypothetical protein